jgi:hypothetical protein
MLSGLFIPFQILDWLVIAFKLSRILINILRHLYKRFFLLQEIKYVSFFFIVTSFFFMIIAKMMPALYILFQMNLGVHTSPNINWAFSGFMTFLTVYEVKPISQDPVSSRKLWHIIPHFPDKWIFPQKGKPSPGITNLWNELFFLFLFLFSLFLSLSLSLSISLSLKQKIVPTFQPLPFLVRPEKEISHSRGCVTRKHSADILNVSKILDNHFEYTNTFRSLNGSAASR